MTVVKLMYQAFMRGSIPRQEGSTPLVKSGEGLVRLLLEAKAEVDAPNSVSNTPSHECVALFD